MAQPTFVQSWDDLEDWVRRDRVAEVRKGRGLCSSLAISFVGDRPDIMVETPPPLPENVDEIVAGLTDLFGALRPARLAVIWPNTFELPTGELVLGVRLNLAEADGAGRWRWTTRILPYMLDAKNPRKIAEWGPPFELPRPPDPGSRALRKMFRSVTFRRLQRRGWLQIPPRDGWDVACHPDSTTMDEFDYLDGATVRNGRLVFQA